MTSWIHNSACLVYIQSKGILHHSVTSAKGIPVLLKSIFVWNTIKHASYFELHSKGVGVNGLETNIEVILIKHN